MTKPPSFEPSPRGPRRRGTTPRRPTFDLPNTSLSVVIVTVTSGLMFGMSAANARQGNESSGELVELVRHRHAIVDELDYKTAELQSTIDALVAENTGTAPPQDDGLTLAQSPLQGPGLTITLSDAPPGPIPENARPDDLVIHQQDIENVMNALWAGGAEAMSIQGKRITSRTVIRCIGNVIYIDGASYSPPYMISAIGDVEGMLNSVNTDRAIEIYQAYVAAYGLGWKLEQHDVLELTAAHAEPAVQHAQVMENDG